MLGMANGDAGSESLVDFGKRSGYTASKRRQLKAADNAFKPDCTLTTFNITR